MKNSLQVTENAVVSMTSREIAELTGKRHDNVMRTIDTLVENCTISHPQIEGGIKGANGVVERLYKLNKRDSIVVVARLSPEFTAAVVDRWQELEVQALLPAVTADHSELLVEINARLEGIERTQTPTLAKKSVQNWNGHYARDLARVQGEIRTLKLRIKQIEPKPDGEQAERSYLKRLIQHQLILEEIIHRNNQYQQLWSQYQTLLEQVENP